MQPLKILPYEKCPSGLDEVNGIESFHNTGPMSPGLVEYHILEIMVLRERCPSLSKEKKMKADLIEK